MPRKLLVLLSLAAPAACGTAEAGSVAAARDSAGVHIVETPAAAEGAVPLYWVDETALVTIGVDEGAPEYQLSAVRGAVRLEDGTLVVANAHSHELRFYDGEGRFIHAVGGKGGGPGEFQSLDGLVAYRGDSVAVWDMGPRRISVFGPDGAMGRAVTVEGITSLAARLVGSFGDGSFIMAGVGSLEDYLRTDAGARRDSVTYLRVAPDGAVADTLGRQGSLEYVVERTGSHMLLQPVLFGRDSYIGVGNDRAFVGESDRFRVDAVAPDGAVRTSIRRPGALREPSREERVRARQAAADAREAQRTESRQPASGAEVPERDAVPAFDALVVDAQGHLWVRDFVTDPAEPPRWSVFSPDGALVATVRTPPGLEVYQVGPDWVMGRSRDELDVESVRVHRLHRAQPPA